MIDISASAFSVFHTFDLLRTPEAAGGLSAPAIVEFKIIDHAERATKIMSVESPPGWTKRAAIIHRRGMDLAAEIAVLQRVRGCLPALSRQQRPSRTITVVLRLALQADLPRS